MFKRFYTKVIGAVIFLTAINRASAISILTIGDTHELGFVDPGIPAGDPYIAPYLNQLITMSLGATTNIDGNTFTRSLNSFSSLDAAVFASRTTASDTVTIDLGTGGYEYLLAKYDGPNYGSEVWYIGGLTGSLSIPSRGGTYGISGTSLFTGTPGTPVGPGPAQSVPDSGSALGMFGSALAAMMVLRRKTAPAS
ncbi:MAG: VPDSG-CTERM sorting domain-containing protein [Chthoniobacteraceae bacterium]